MSSTLELTKQLISQASVTPNDAGCQRIMADRLQRIGFHIEPMPFGEGAEQVQNLWARRGSEPPLVVFAGHTDVVPTGDLQDWQSDPFQPTERNGQLYGRGAADMKGSLAAFITAIESFVAEQPDHAGSIGLLITSDEEGPAQYGTVKVVETLQARGETIDYCVVGEPSSTRQLGDVIKNGRRGSLGCELTVTGKQGHVAYPHLATNPIHYLGAVIEQLTAVEWDSGNDYFPATSLQISNLNAGTGATNVIPGSATLVFNLRFSTETSDQHIRDTVENLLSNTLNDNQISYQTQWRLSGQPFPTPQGKLVEACQRAIRTELGITTELSTAGGTSDGRFIAPTGAEVVELGPVNASIHQIDEHVAVDALEGLSRTYRTLLRNLLSN